MREKGAIELETVVKLVVVLVVLIVILLFFSGGFGSMGGKLANTTKDTTGSVDDVNTAIKTTTSSGNCVEVDTDINACRVRVKHPTGCPAGDLSPAPPPGTYPPNNIPPGPQFTGSFCGSKCKIKVTACFGTSPRLFDYSVWEV